MAVLSYIVSLLAFLSFHAVLVTSQFSQTYREEPGPVYWYMPDGVLPGQKVIDLSPDTVYLEYNCYYLKSICKNAKAFLATPRGQKILKAANSFPVFGFDTHTGDTSTWRDNQRRSQSCPSSWKSRHPCPESDQEMPMKHNGQWFTTVLDPNVDPKDYPISNRYDSNGNLLELSNIRYTCEEFPAASWVEGGTGLDRLTPASTRCAPMACGRGTKSEQNWQSFAHAGLSSILKAAVQRRNDASVKAGQSPEFPDFIKKKKDSIIFFTFNTYTSADGIAAQVVAYDEDGDDIAVPRARVVPQVKRRSGANETESAEPDWKPDGDAMHRRLMAKVAAGNATRHMVLVNDTDTGFDTTTPWAVYGQHDLERRVKLQNDQQGAMEREAIMSHWTLDEDALHNADDAVRAPGLAQRRRQRSGSAAVDLSHDTTAPLLKRMTNTTVATNTTLFKATTHATNTTLEHARQIVAKAIAESARRNQARYEQPARNVHRLKPGTVLGGTTLQRREDSIVTQNDAEDNAPPPLLDITDEIAHAAALVAEAEAYDSARAGNLTRRLAPAGTFWMEGLARKGSVPWGDNSTYVVFRNVRNYGATGNGVTDDTAAIKRAMNDGKRCGEKCNGSTTKNAIVYFPPGTYLVSSTIPVPFGTQVIGDANTRPLILAAPSFVGMGVLSVNEYAGGGAGIDGLDRQWFINTANFYRQLRNVIIDVRATAAAQKVACLHYQVAQATSTQNVQLIAGPSQYGIFAENGSGGQISDIVFTGGAYGIYGGAQQFTAQRLQFNGCAVGVALIWDWGWLWKSVVMNNVGTGFKLLAEVGGTGNIGSVSVMDSSFTGVSTVIQITPPSSAPGSGTTGIILENVVFANVGKGVTDTSGATILAGTAGTIEHWALGPVYSGAGTRSFSTGAKVGNYQRARQLTNPSTGAYFERAKPQYESSALGDFVHIKDYGAVGNGVTDDTAAMQRALWAAQGKILFIDAGSYILTSTITVPTGSRIVGETWSQLVAYGPFFGDASNPKVLIKVGDQGQIGDVEVQDLIITTKGPTAGAILIEWNIQASSAGSAGMWDVHVRVGGAKGTGLTPDECPALLSGVNARCNAASLMMHLTPSASGYFENMWLWVSDHNVDDPNLTDDNNPMVQNSVYAARGFLVESTHATWLYGTASEHAVFYQYNFNKASNIFAGMLQTESPYYQPTPPPPAPFTKQVGLLPGDPDYTCAPNNEFSGCDESWGLMVRGSSNLIITGAGLYSWFSTYSQDCIDGQLCQKALALFDKNAASVRIENLVTIGAKYMVVMNGIGIKAADNLNVRTHPSWSQISVLDITSNNGAQYDRMIWVDPKVWDMPQPQFTCIPPCNVQLPPWTGATTTINYPLITVSSGTWKSTITKPPLTVSEWKFQVLTITAAGSGSKKRQAFGDVYPVPAVTSTWPSVVYTGPNGLRSTVAPTAPAPKPPASIGPNAVPPPQGSWPSKPIRAVSGTVNQPVVDECAFPDDKCPASALDDELAIRRVWGGTDGDDDDDYDENWAEATVTCPLRTSSTTTSAPTPTKTLPAPPTYSPRLPDPQLNEVACNDSGQRVNHGDLDLLNRQVCGQIDNISWFWTRDLDSQLRNGYRTTRTLYTSEGGDTAFEYTFELYSGCTWTSFTIDECVRYYAVVADSCNCNGLNGKQGGSVGNNCLSFGVDTIQRKGWNKIMT